MKWSHFGDTSFEQLAGIYQAMGWKHKDSYPTADSLRQTCSALAETIAKEGYTASASSGRLRVTKFRPLTGYDEEYYMVALENPIHFKGFSSHLRAQGKARKSYRETHRAGER